MKKLIIYLFYGFYQIDYVFGRREYPSYNTRTGGALLLTTLFLYICSFTNVVFSLILRLLNTDGLTNYRILMIYSFVTLIAMWRFDNSIVDSKFYYSGFQELDKLSSLSKLLLFSISSISFVIGLYLFFNSIWMWPI